MAYDATLDAILDAWGRLKIKGEPATVKRIAEEAGLHVSAVWRRWAKVAPCGGEPTKVDYTRGLGERHHDEIQRRVALVRAAKSLNPMLEGLDAETLSVILPD